MSDNTENNIVETTFYTFDNALLTSNGYVEINQNNVLLHFPDISIANEQPSSNYKCVQIFVNNQLKFSFDWLPFFSFYDRVRIMDMFVKSYELFCNMIQGTFFLPFPHTNKSNYSYSSIVTTFNQKNKFQMKCLEDYLSLTIQITLIKQDENVNIEFKEFNLDHLPENGFNFKISIGNNYVFDSTREFEGIEQCYINFIIQFLLYKIVNIN
jgi:hypothetical protein